MPKPRSYTDDEKTAALAFYERLGLAEACRQTGIPRGTISSWAVRSGTKTQSDAAERMRPAMEQLAAENAATRARIKQKLLTTSEKLIDLAGEGTTKPKDAQALAIAVGIFIDKYRLESGEADKVYEQLTRRQALDDGKQRAGHLRPVREAS